MPGSCLGNLCVQDPRDQRTSTAVSCITGSNPHGEEWMKALIRPVGSQGRMAGP